VHVGEETVGAIDYGLLALVAVVSGDDLADVAHVADRLRHLRIFADDEGRMNRSVEDVGGDLLLVSQFTLAADTRKGRRPSFSRAAPPDVARRYFERLVDTLVGEGLRVQTGSFGAHMKVHSINDGPVTVIVDSAAGRRAGGSAS
jgi:D-tyrosyl-tRNA(Tyr) deacylase